MIFSQIRRLAQDARWLTARTLHSSSTIYSSQLSPTSKIRQKAGLELGDPYVTTIQRRRPIKDLSIPKFENGVESLKWTNWRMRRDVKRRILNSRYYHFRSNMKNIASCKTLPSIVRDIAVAERNDTPRESSLNQIVNRCALTSRPRGKLLKWRLSRIVWRDLADHGLMSGVIRAKWG